MKIKILVALQTFGEYSQMPVHLLKGSGAEIVMNDLRHRLLREEIVRLGKNCEGIIAGVEPYDEEVLDKLPMLKCISRCGVGTDNIDKKEAQKRKIAVLNTPDVVIQPVAEMTLAMAFDLLRLLSYHTSVLRSKQWKKKAGRLLAGSKVGVIGLGRIGKRVAEMFCALKAEVYGADISPDKDWAQKQGIKIMSGAELLKEVDILCLHVSVSAEDPFIMGEKELSSMKPGSIVINTSRGKVVDEKALYNALSSGHLAGAGLDVYSQEPYEGPLRDLDNVVLTPHIATLTRESRARMEKEAVENLLRYFELI